MHNAEIIRVVARRTGRSTEEISEIADAFLDAVITALVLGEDVQLVGFGRFVPDEWPPRGGQPRTTLKFVPSRRLKKEMSGEIPLGWHKQKNLPVYDPDGSRRPSLLPESKLHAALWELADPVDHRLEMDLHALAQHLGVGFGMVKRAMAAAKEAGRVMRTPSRSGLVGRYVIADPTTWRADDPSTHARRIRTPQWS